MDKLTKQLFGRFPREIGLFRSIVNNIEQFHNYILYKNGLEDLYTSLYPSNFLIDKVLFDLDWGKHVLEDAKKLYATAQEEGFQVIPVVSGKKGYHLHLICKPKIHGAEAKIRILRTQYYLLEKAFGKFRSDTKTLKGKETHFFRNKTRIIAPDPAICGDVRRLIRIPNSLRPPENINYCTYLPPHDFLDMNELDIIEYMKITHNPKVTINYRRAPDIENFEYEFEHLPIFSENPIEFDDDKGFHCDNKYLQGILRPCLYRHITHMHPTNYVRYATTLDLLTLGLSVNNIVSLYSGLGWEDFNKELTKDKITWIRGKMKEKPEIYHSPSCGSLRYRKIPNNCCVD